MKEQVTAMTDESADQLERLLRDNDLGWVIDVCAPPETAATCLSGFLNRADQLSQQRFGAHAPRISAESLMDQEDGLRVKAFLQALASRFSPEMLVAAWRIIFDGLTIQSCNLEYERLNRFAFQLVLATPDGSQEVYASDDIRDALFLRHLPSVMFGGKPLFQGFFALRIH
jgi:hypothetical protein